MPKQKKERPEDNRLFGGRRVLGNSLGTLRHGVLSQLTGEDQTNTGGATSQSRRTIEMHQDSAGDLRGLDLPGRDGGLLVVGSELAGLCSNALEDVVHEGVQDRHGTVGDTSVGVDLLEDWTEN